MWKRVKLAAMWMLLVCATGGVVYKLWHSRELSEFRSQRVLQTLAHVRFSYILLGVGLVFSSYFLRSLRWREFVAPIKRASLGGIFSSTVIGFSAIALLG